MEVLNIKDKDSFLTEYVKLCSDEWGSKKTPKEMEDYINTKKEQIAKEDKVISILGLINNNELIGFISLFKYDGEERRDLTPWYATMYVKEEYRHHGYSKLLNEELLKEAKRLGYEKVYLKSDLKNYYEKFGAIYMEKLNNGENLYYISLKEEDANNEN